MAVIETIVARGTAVKPILPNTLNTMVATRVFPSGLRIVLIPESISMNRQTKLFDRRISNTVWLIPKMDVCVTSFEIFTEQIEELNTSHTGREFNLTVKLVDKSNKRFINFQVPTKSGMRSTVLKNKFSNWILKKDRQVCITVVYRGQGTSRKIPFKNVPCDVVSHYLQKSQVGFRKIHFSTSAEAPAFLTSISYAIPNELNTSVDERVAGVMHGFGSNDTSSSEDDVESEVLSDSSDYSY